MNKYETVTASHKPHQNRVKQPWVFLLESEISSLALTTTLVIDEGKEIMVPKPLDLLLVNRNDIRVAKTQLHVKHLKR